MGKLSLQYRWVCFWKCSKSNPNFCEPVWMPGPADSTGCLHHSDMQSITSTTLCSNSA